MKEKTNGQCLMFVEKRSEVLSHSHVLAVFVVKGAAEPECCAADQLWCVLQLDLTAGKDLEFLI